MKRYVVTGGAGFIGTNLIMRLMKNHEVVMLDHDLKKSVLYENADIKLANVDVTDRAGVMKVIKEFNPHCVFHLAGFIDVRKSIENPLQCAKDNIEGTINVLDACREAGSRLVFTSSCAVYGDPERLPNFEEHCPKPISPYGIAKYTAEAYVRSYYKTYKLKTIALRLSNVYGLWNRKGAVHLFIDNLLHNEGVNIFGTGEQKRDLVFVDDVVDALITASTDNHYGQVFNIATGKSTSVNDMVRLITETIRDVTGQDVHATTNYTNGIKGEILNSYASITRAREYLGWTPKTSFKDGIKKTVEWHHKR